MVALLVVTTFVVLLLGILVAGLLRSHADILRALHDLGVGVGDPSADDRETNPVPPRPTALGPAPPVAGVTPSGDARSVAVDHTDRFTLLGFLSSGCATCAGFWNALQAPDGMGLPDRTRIVIVTKGPDRETPSEVAAHTTGRVPVIMSTEAWVDYEVPGSPFFVLVDGSSGNKVGQGVANGVAQLVELVRRAERDRAREHVATDHVSGVGGPARESAADDVLQAAGIPPGHPSLYPRTLDDVFPFGRSSLAPADEGAAKR